MSKVINIVGYSSNVGKTLLIENLIKELKSRGYSIATIKHDVHGFDMDKEGKDTWRHRKAGAEQVCISSKNRFAMIKEVEEELMEALRPGYVAGLTLLGGEPFEPENQRALLPFLKKVRERFPKKNIWCYTGYLFDKELLGESRARCECTDEMLSLIDVLVDGEFVQELYSVALAFRGSENQRIIDEKKSLETGEIVWHALMSRGISMKFN